MKQPYQGNQIAYRQRKEIVKGWSMPNLGIKQGDTIYSYFLWNGESYKYWRGKEFCGTKCASMWAYDRN